MSASDFSSPQRLKETGLFWSEKATDAWKKQDYKLLLFKRCPFAFVFFLSQSPFNQVSTVGGLLGPRPSNELAVVRDPSS